MEYQKPFVYIDTNFSPDDGLLLKMAFASFNFELVGLSANSSYMTSKRAGENILALNVKEGLYLSVSTNLEDASQSRFDKEIFSQSVDYLEEMDAKDKLYELASDCGRLDIVASGDLSNLVRALKEYEDLSQYIDHIFLVLRKNSKDKAYYQDLDYILSSDIDLFMIEEDFDESLKLAKDFLDKKENKDESLAKIFDEYVKMDEGEKLLNSSLLLYILECPEAFIFEELGLRVDFENKNNISIDTSRKKNYLVNKVNKEAFFDYIKGKLC